MADDHELQVLASARGRLLSGQRTTLAGAILDKVDSDLAASLVEAAYTERGKSGEALDAVEKLIANEIDNGQSYPIGNAEAFAGVQWIAMTDPASLPNPMPRAYALYFAIAWQKSGRYGTVSEGLTYILTNFNFI